MAVQGIIKGYCDPVDYRSNLMLIGRGDSYVMLRHGQPQYLTIGLDIALTAFSQQAAKYCERQWIAITGITTDSNGNSNVTCVDHSQNYGQTAECGAS